MSTDTRIMNIDDDILEVAAQWHLRLISNEIAKDDPELLLWLQISSDHQEALDTAQMAWGAVGDFAAEPELMILRRDALARSTKIAQSRWDKPWGRWRIPNFKWARIVAAALVFTVVGVGINSLDQGVNDPTPSVLVAESIFDTYQTDIGETRVVTLADNSKISLDAASKIKVRLSDNLRDIELLAGQAHFDVAKDPTRPFRVRAGDQVVVATGTAFNIELLKDEVLVTLIEGEVVVSEEKLSPNKAIGKITENNKAVLKSHILKPGQQLVASLNAEAEIIEDADITKATSWQRGKLIFEDEPLSVAVERMNRHSRINIVLGEDSWEEFGINGVFNAGDVDAFVEALEAYYPEIAKNRSRKSINLYLKD